MFGVNIFTLIKGSVGFITENPESSLSPVKAFIRSFTKKTIENVQINTVTVRNYCCIAHILTEGLSLLKTELSIPIDDLQEILHRNNKTRFFFLQNITKKKKKKGKKKRR